MDMWWEFYLYLVISILCLNHDKQGLATRLAQSCSAGSREGILYLFWDCLVSHSHLLWSRTPEIHFPVDTLIHQGILDSSQWVDPTELLMGKSSFYCTDKLECNHSWHWGRTGLLRGRDLSPGEKTYSRLWREFQIPVPGEPHHLPFLFTFPMWAVLSSDERM